MAECVANKISRLGLEPDTRSRDVALGEGELGVSFLDEQLVDDKGGRGIALRL